MKTAGAPYWYVSGPHARDYYLLQDEESELMFDTRLAEHMREANVSTLLEMWIDDTARHVWYLFARYEG